MSMVVLYGAYWAPPPSGVFEQNTEASINRSG